MYQIHITVIIAVPWQNVHWLTGRLIFVIDAPAEVLAAAAQGHSHDVEKGPEKSSKSKKGVNEWKRQKDLNKCNCKCDWHVELCSILVTMFTRYCATVSYSITASQHHHVSASESHVLSNKFHANVAVSLPRRQPRPRRAQQPVLNVCSQWARKSKNTFEN